MCDEKRKRSPNWLPSEKKLLVELVQSHFSIVENKKTDGVSMKAKLAEWQIISIEYNSQTTHCHREAENLRSQWENMKKAAKKEASHARMRRIQTGGGPPDTKKEDPVYSRILSLIKTSAEGLYNPYDNDSVAPVKEDMSLESEYVHVPCNKDLEQRIGIDQPLPVNVDINMGGPTSVDIEVKDCVNYTLVPTPLIMSNQTCINMDEDVSMKVYKTQEVVDKHKDWGDYTPQLLKTPLSAQLRKDNKTGMSRRRPLNTPAMTSLELLHKKKIDAINLQKVLATEEAEGKRILTQLEIDIKKEILKQEKLKTRMLLLELRKKKKLFKEN